MINLKLNKKVNSLFQQMIANRDKYMVSCGGRNSGITYLRKSERELKDESKSA